MVARGTQSHEVKSEARTAKTELVNCARLFSTTDLMRSKTCNAKAAANAHLNSTYSLR